MRNDRAISVMTAILEDARKVRLLEWLTTPPEHRNPQTFELLADELGVTSRALRFWRADRAFRDLWEKEAKVVLGDPERIQRLLQAQFDIAMNDEMAPNHRTKAAEVYLKAVDAIKPPAIDMARKAAAELTDTELEAMIAEAAQRTLSERQAAPVGQ